MPSCLQVKEATATRLCGTQRIMTVNGEFPGPTVEVSEGDALIVRVLNRGSYNVTVHWHGVRQMRTGWSDGPEFVTQCPIRPGNSYTYRFTVAGQEGTLWWHAHSSWLRATVHGALIIHPRRGLPYPFPKPQMDAPVILGTIQVQPVGNCIAGCHHQCRRLTDLNAVAEPPPGHPGRPAGLLGKLQKKNFYKML